MNSAGFFCASRKKTFAPAAFTLNGAVIGIELIIILCAVFPVLTIPASFANSLLSATFPSAITTPPFFIYFEISLTVLSDRDSVEGINMILYLILFYFVLGSQFFLPLIAIF